LRQKGALVQPELALVQREPPLYCGFNHHFG
jgi:hypothetical protein